MTQKFKIRFWDKDLNKMRYEIFGKGCFSHPNIVPMLGCEVNGVIIYEGDILGGFEIVDGEWIESRIPIVFDNGSFWTDESFEKDGSYLNLLCEYGEPLKIIGNIYEETNLKTESP